MMLNISIAHAADREILQQQVKITLKILGAFSSYEHLEAGDLPNRACLNDFLHTVVTISEKDERSFFLQYCSHRYWMGSNDY